MFRFLRSVLRGRVDKCFHLITHTYTNKKKTLLPSASPHSPDILHKIYICTSQFFFQSWHTERIKPVTHAFLLLSRSSVISGGNTSWFLLFFFVTFFWSRQLRNPMLVTSVFLSPDFVLMRCLWHSLLFSEDFFVVLKFSHIQGFINNLLR